MVPARSYQELMRILSDTDDPVNVMLATAKSQVIFSVEGTELVSRLIDGQFPNYQQVLPTSHASRAVVEREDLLKAVRLSALIASTAANVVRLKVGEDGQRRDHHRGQLGLGDAEGEVEASLEGDAVTIAFNARYLTEALAQHGRRPARAGVQRTAFARRPRADRGRRATST